MRILRRPWSQRERFAERVGAVLDPFMSELAVVQALAYLMLNDCFGAGSVRSALEVAVLVVWPLFIIEYVARWIIHPGGWRFLRSNWWEIPILVLPLLRFVRLVRLARLARTGRALGSVVRTGRPAGLVFLGRLGWLTTVHVTVVFLGVNILCDHGGYSSLALAFHDAALLASNGTVLSQDSGVGQILEVALGVWAVVVFGAIAGAFGSFFLESRQEEAAPPPA